MDAVCSATLSWLILAKTAASRWMRLQNYARWSVSACWEVAASQSNLNTRVYLPFHLRRFMFQSVFTTTSHHLATDEVTETNGDKKKGAMQVFSTLCAFSCVTVRPSDRLDSRGSAVAAPRPRGALLGEHRSGDHLRPALQRSHRWDLCSALPRARPGHVWPRPQQLRHLWHHAGGGRSRAWDPQAGRTRGQAHM